MQRGYQEQFYHAQNIDLRKEIRQWDMRVAQGEGVSCQCNFLVVGPPKVGKTHLLRTLHFALNGSQGCIATSKGAMIAYDIKRGSKYSIEGVKQLKEISQKLSIAGWELQSDEKPSVRYKRALDYVQAGIGHCMVNLPEIQQSAKAKVCLIVLDVSSEMRNDELSYLRFLRADLFERGIKTFLVLIGSSDRHSEHWKTVESKIAALKADLQIKRDDIICLDVYRFEEQKPKNKLGFRQSEIVSKVEKNEETNFYALQLLLKIVRESERYTKSYGIKTGKGWLCNWN